MTAVDFDTLNAWADRLSRTAETAGSAVMEVYRRDFSVESKADNSPVTEADQASERIILAELAKLTPVFPIVAEEQVAAHGAPEFEGDTFWLVDALDGTKEFIRKGTDFTVNIGFVAGGVPMLGIVHVPAQNVTYLGICAPGGTRRAEVTRSGAKTPIATRPRPHKVMVAGSRSHEIAEDMNAFLAKYDVAGRLIVGSSLKFCMVAEGKADLYPRFGPTCEWDTAAGHAVLRAAGGRVHTFDGHELLYKKPGFLNGRFLAEGPP